MLIGVFSDVHDNLANLRRALEVFKERGAAALIFCGDFCSPIPSRVMGAEFKGDIHIVFGNGDGDRFAISNVAKNQYPNCSLTWPIPKNAPRRTSGGRWKSLSSSRSFLT